MSVLSKGYINRYIYIMEMDVMRITTLPYGERKGTLVSSEYEDKLTSGYPNDDAPSLIYQIRSKDVALFDIDSINDGDYNINLFEQVYIAASYVGRVNQFPRL